MVLSKSVAHQLVKRLSPVLEQHINIMNTDGIIISSTDPLRIGSIHGGARHVLSENLAGLLIEDDDEYEGARGGINLPIVFGDEIVGVIGITGSSDEVAKYGQIIKKMTEILLLDNYTQEQKIIEQKAHDRFLDEWVFGKLDLRNHAEFTRRAQLLGIAPKKIKRVALFSAAGIVSKSLSDNELTNISREARALISTCPGAEMFRTSTRFVCLFEDSSDEKLISIMSGICSKLNQRFNCEIHVGIDSGAPFSHIRDAYEHADKALSVSLHFGKQITIFDELDFKQFITFAPESSRQGFLSRLFVGASQSEIDYWISFLKVFYACNGSISKAALELNMHKNTVQYKLVKLSSQTGFDPRQLKSSALFLVAIELYDFLKIQNDGMQTNYQ